MKKYSLQGKPDFEIKPRRDTTMWKIFYKVLEIVVDFSWFTFKVWLSITVLCIFMALIRYFSGA